MRDKLFFGISLLLIFIISPFLSVFLSSFLLILKLKDTFYINLFLFQSIIFLATLNSSVLPESDIENYYMWYNLAKEYPISQYIFLFPAEPFFTGLTYVLYYLTLGNENVYLWVLTALIYFPVCTGIIKFYRKEKLMYLLPIALFSFLFLPQVFSLSNNIIRQMLAGSIFAYFAISREIHKKNFLYLYVIAVFIHSSVLLFLPVLVINSIKNISFKKYVSLLLLLLASISSYRFILGFINDILRIPVLNLILERVVRVPHSIYSPPSLAVLVFGIFLSIFGIWCAFRFKRNDYFKLISYFLVLIVFTIINYNNTQISSRLILYVYYFLPVIFPFIFYKLNRRSLYLASFLVLFFFISLFILGFMTSIYSYETGARSFIDMFIAY